MCGLIVVIWLCLTIAGPPVRAAPVSDERAAGLLDKYIDAFAANQDFSGVVLVTRDGRQIFEKSVGMASVPFDQPNHPDTRFLVASVTKTFTAAGIALLQIDGKLNIEDRLDVYLPDFMPASKIMLWHLLGHQSGLADPDYTAIAAKAVTPGDLLAMIGEKPLLFEPGTSSQYSNAGYITLAQVIESVSGEPFGDFLERRIFSPLEMTNSGALSAGPIVPKLAEGYIPGVGAEIMRPQPRDPSSLYGSGNVYSTVRDLDRWLTAIDKRELFDISKQVYPFGWGRRTWFEKDVLVQSGMTNGYCSVILTVPEEALHIVVLMNVQTGFTGDEGKTLLGIIHGQPANLPARRGAPARIASATLEGYAGLYVWGDGKVPMHIETDGRVLTLRWADSASVVPLTPLSGTEFLDRASFGTIRFHQSGLEWTQNGETTKAPRSRE